jgi:hypothetical protein
LVEQNRAALDSRKAQKANLNLDSLAPRGAKANRISSFKMVDLQVFRLKLSLRCRFETHEERIDHGADRRRAAHAFATRLECPLENGSGVALQVDVPPPRGRDGYPD